MPDLVFIHNKVNEVDFCPETYAQLRREYEKHFDEGGFNFRCRTNLSSDDTTDGINLMLLPDLKDPDEPSDFLRGTLKLRQALSRLQPRPFVCDAKKGTLCQTAITSLNIIYMRTKTYKRTRTNKVGRTKRKPRRRYEIDHQPIHYYGPFSKGSYSRNRKRDKIYRSMDKKRGRMNLIGDIIFLTSAALSSTKE